MLLMKKTGLSVRQNPVRSQAASAFLCEQVDND